ncbi:hypothetical protein [Yeosuana sp. AK3]
MKELEIKILKAIETNRLNPEILGKRNGYAYFIRITELGWSRNLKNAYSIEDFDEKYGKYLASLTV